VDLREGALQLILVVGGGKVGGLAGGILLVLFLSSFLLFSHGISIFFLSTWLCYSSTTVLFASGNFIA